MKNKVYIISPSALSYKCNHCEYLKHHFDLENRGVPVGVTQTLDAKEKNFFITHGTKAIDPELPNGEVIDPGNTTFSSIKFKDLKKREFRIRGKGDGIIRFDDGTCGIIDYKTSKFKKNHSKDYSFKSEDLEKKIKEYNTIITKKNNAFVKFKNETKSLFLEKLMSIVEKYAEDNSIKLILKKENIIIGMNNLDISNNILKLLNEKINDINLK